MDCCYIGHHGATDRAILHCCQPDANYQACTALLCKSRSWSMSPPTTAIASRPTTYSKWGASYNPDGLFFDETSSQAQLSIYQTYASQVHTSFGTSYESSHRPTITVPSLIRLLLSKTLPAIQHCQCCLR